MSKQHDEISRFNVNGKTFFFNKGEASNGNSYLAINALWQENMERMTVFPNQLLEFRSHLDGAIEEITGLTPADGGSLCPNCDSQTDQWDVERAYHTEHERPVWVLYCTECGGIILSSEPNDANAAEMLEEAEDGWI